jgi:ABC-2 type transport system permease protein
MNWHRTWIVVRREWLELRKNKMLVGSLVALPAILIPMAVAGIAIMALGVDGEDANAFARVANVPPELLATHDGRIMGAMLIGEQMLVYMLLMPLLLPQMVTATSIVGEKEAKSLEPLLATPIETRELLFAKTLAAVVPATFITWASFALVAIGVYVISPYVATAVVLRPTWIFGFALHSPLLGLLSALVGVMGSSRAKDVKSAQSLGGLLLLPLFGFSMWLITAQVLVSLAMQVGAAVVMMVVVFPLMRIAVALFQREKILTQWR